MEADGQTLEKLDILHRIIKEMGSVAIAFSGGVDSSFLLAASYEVLGDLVIAATAISNTFPVREAQQAREFCKSRGIRQIEFVSCELDNPLYCSNPINRCYLCKHTIFSQILSIAREQHINCVAEGSNADDTGDYRPGMQAVKELGIRSPLLEAGLTKAEIRTLSRQMGLPTWNKPSYACLSSRFPYGEEISREKLFMVERAEEYLHLLGLLQVRVRIHGNLARIEALPEDFETILSHRKQITEELKSYGFTFVTMDLLGYRTGSLNETLHTKGKMNIQDAEGESADDIP